MIEALDDITSDTPTVEHPNDRPAHLARCAECTTEVQFKPSITGSSFTLVEGLDQTFGVGPNGRPICPHGHGEMAIADDQSDQFQSAHDAFTEAADRLADAVQRDLPGVVPPFNYAGAFGEIVDQARQVEALKSDYDEKKQDAADAKKSLDKAAELLMKMTLEFERRRLAKDPSDEAPTFAAPSQPCAWKAKHPDADCPICDVTVPTFEQTSHLGDLTALAPKDASGHADDVEKLLLGMEVYELQQAFEKIDTYIPDAVIREWSSDDRKAAIVWADRQDDLINGVAQADDPDAPARPDVLGKPHVPEDPLTAEGPQRCSICEAVLPKADGSYLYAVTDLVGTDCSGKAPVAGHHYPDKKKGKGRKK